jgi:hypothetical protein
MKLKLLITLLTLSITASCIKEEASLSIRQPGSADGSSSGGSSDGSFSGGSSSGSSSSGGSTPPPPPPPNTIDEYTSESFDSVTSFDANMQAKFSFPIDPNDVSNVAFSSGQMQLTGGASVAINYNIPNNSIVDVHLSRSYGSSSTSGDGREAMFIYPTANKDTLSRSGNNLPTFPSSESFGFYTFSSMYNVRVYHNVNDTGAFSTLYGSHSYFTPTKIQNGGRMWRTRFVMRNGSMRMTFSWKGTNTSHYSAAPRSFVATLPGSFDYDDMTFEMIGNQNLKVDDITVSELLECTIPSSIPTGYVLDNCSSGELKTELECNINCDSTTHKVDVTKAFPVLLCSTEGEDFEFSGCIQK